MSFGVGPRTKLETLGRPQQVPMGETPSLGHGIVTPSVRGAVQRKCDQYENEFERVKTQYDTIYYNMLNII